MDAALQLLDERVDGQTIQDKMSLSVRDLFSPAFWRLYNYLERNIGREFWAKGGRGSAKSSFFSGYTTLAMMRDAILFRLGKIPKSALSHAIAYRKIGSDLRDSVFTQFLWSFDKIGCAPWWEINKSSMRLKFIPTGQMILFRGLDDETKSKSIKAPFGFFKYTWFEELAQFSGYKEIRSVKQSVQRGGHGFKTFCSYNPPMTQSNWVNVEANEPADGRFVFHSDYRSVPVEWLGEDFIADAEDLKRRNELVYRHEYLGEITGTGGAVFPNVVIRHISDEERASFDNLHFGQDWGFTNAFAWVAMNYVPKKKRLLIYDEIYQPHLTPSMAARLVKQKNLHGEPIWADCEDASAIAQFNNEFGITTYPVKKGPDSRRFGYRWLQGLFEIVIDPVTAPNCAREFQQMEYKQDRKTGQFLEDYPKEADHSIDAVRYGMEQEIMTRGLF